MEAPRFRFGRSEEQQAFLAKHPDLQKCLPEVRMLTDSVFMRHLPMQKAVDLWICLLGCRCVEDFWEILLLCANGYGIAALRLLRGMYETALTARFLHEHPDREEDLADFFWIDEFKFLQAKREVDGDESVEQEHFDHVKAMRNQVLPRYVMTCGKCGHPGPAPSWFKGGTPGIARAIGGPFPAMLLQAYYEPTRRLHVSMRALLERMIENPDGSVCFNVDAQRGQADWVLCTAHGLVLGAVELQIEHFGIQGFEAVIQRNAEAFGKAWRKATTSGDNPSKPRESTKPSRLADG